MTHGALFNGIAGFPLAAAWAGIHTEWTVEIDEFCNKVSKKHFPHATQYKDIHEARNLPYVDIISGGFPCQPYSVAGKQLGNEDDRALWPQMLRIIREVKPTYVIGENVSGIINLALDDVLLSLENEGYTTETFVVPACAVNAPHRRDRVWIIGYPQYNGQLTSQIRQSIQEENGRSKTGQIESQQFTGSGFKKSLVAAYTNSQQRCERRLHQTEPEKAERYISPFHTRYDRGTWQDFPTQPPICGGNDGISSKLVRNRVKQLKAYGNAIVPQVAYEIFKAILTLETEANHTA